MTNTKNDLDELNSSWCKNMSFAYSVLEEENQRTIRCKRCPMEKAQWKSLIDSLQSLMEYVPGRFILSINSDTIMIEFNDSAIVTSRNSFEEHELVAKSDMSCFIVSVVFVILTELGGALSLSSSSSLESWWPIIDEIENAKIIPNTKLSTFNLHRNYAIRCNKNLIMRSVLDRNDSITLHNTFSKQSKSIYREMALLIAKRLSEKRKLRIDNQINAWIPRLVSILHS